MSGCTKTLPNSVRTIDPVGHDSRQPAFSQCLQTSELNSHAIRSGALPPRPISGLSSTNLTCRQVECPSAPVLSYELPLQAKPSCGTSFHSLHATSQALQPMQRVDSVKKPATVIARCARGSRCEVRTKNEEASSLKPRSYFSFRTSNLEPHLFIS